MDFILNNAAVLVHMASLLYVIAFLVRDQLMLRILVLIATLLYIGYYYFVPEIPLWDAIFWSLVLGAANLYVTVQILLQRTTFNMTGAEKRLCERFDTMTPGEFRRMLKIAHWDHREATLTQENEPVDRLYYVLSGTVDVEKQGRSFTLEAGVFIGEVAYFLKRDASATVKLFGIPNYVYWERDELQKLEQKNPGIRVALHSLLNTDMAAKVAVS